MISKARPLIVFSDKQFVTISYLLFKYFDHFS